MPHRKTALALATFLLLPVLPWSASAQTSGEAFIPLKTDTPPVIDGRLDDPVWSRAPSETGFKLYAPDYGADMLENTVVWYAYDQDNLFFAFRCSDSRPDLIKTSVTARDRIRADDWICLNLDTFNDHQSLYCFYVNPLGIQMDSRFTAVGEDMSIDFVWYSAGRIDEQGFTIEIRIPFKSIRYTRDDPVEMGIIFERFISRLTQAGTYPALDPRQGPNFLTQTRPLLYAGIRRYTLLELLPAVTYGATSEQSGGRLSSLGDESTFSLTGKYGLTSHLVLDGTYKPDFSQVEADAGQVDFNQRYALYYEEKRPFFLEGRENFDFAAVEAGEPLSAVVYTRTIEKPVFGVKLTGKVGARNTFAAIYAADEPSADPILGDRAEAAVLRYKRALSNDSYVGGFYTGREVEGGFNRVYGADGQIRLTPASILGFHGFLSSTRVPGSGATDGHAASLDYRFTDRNRIINVKVQDLSTGFDTWTGYLVRNGLTRYKFGFLPMIYPGSPLVLRIDPLMHSIHLRDHESGMWERYNAFDLRLLLPRSTAFQVGFSSSNEVWQRRHFDTGRLRVSASSQYTRQISLAASWRKGKKIRYLLVDPWQGEGTDAGLSVTYQPSDHFSSGLSWTYSDLFHEDTGDKEYDYTILRSRNTYQVNRFLFFRAIVEYNSFYEEVTTDLLASFTYIPGTVIHIGYGSLYQKLEWDEGLEDYVAADRFLETRRGLFFKTSFLWRL
jgi:hypothetical protein